MYAVWPEQDLINRIRDLEAQLAEARELVNKQSEDEGLWCIAETAFEEYLQQELRRLHAAIEGE